MVPIIDFFNIVYNKFSLLRANIISILQNTKEKHKKS